MASTPFLDMTLLVEGAQGNESYVNRMLGAMDSGVLQGIALAVSNNGTAIDYNSYIVGAAPTGEFAGATPDDFAYYQGQWFFITPRTGWRIYDIATTTELQWNGAAWAALVPGAGGSTTQVQFNDVGNLNGDAGFTFDKATLDVAVGRDIAATRNVSAVGITGSGTVQGATVTATGTVNAVDVAASGTVQGATVTATGTVNAVDVAASGDVDAVGTVRHAGIFAEIHVADASTAQSIPTGATYTKITPFTDNGLSSNMTPDQANDKITITETGLYEVVLSMSALSGTTGVVFECAAFLDAVEQHQVHWRRKFANTDVGAMPASGVIDVTSVPVDLDLRMSHDNGGAVNFTVAYANLMVKYLGET